jgi:hypothetical protein
MRLRRLAAVVALTALDQAAHAGGFGAEAVAPAATATAPAAVAERVGRAYWIYYDRPTCGSLAPKIYRSITQEGTNLFFRASEPIRLQIANTLHHKMQWYYLLNIENVGLAYASASDRWQLGEETIFTRKTECVSELSPEESRVRLEQLKAQADEKRRDYEALLAEDAARTEQRRKGIGLRMGMTADAVSALPQWRGPTAVNRTRTARGIIEQWVFDGGQYLYFTNGKLTAAQY